MAARKQSAQLDLFPPAPGTKRSRGRGVSRDRDAALMALVDRARRAGCTHLELEKGVALFVTDNGIGRCTTAHYVPLSHPHLVAYLRPKSGLYRALVGNRGKKSLTAGKEKQRE